MPAITGHTGKTGVRARREKSEEERLQTRISKVEQFLLKQLDSPAESDSAKVSAAKALYDKLKPTLAAVEQHTIHGADLASEDQIISALESIVAQRPQLVDHLVAIRDKQRQAEKAASTLQ